MGYRVTIDIHSGFCPGVINAIERAQTLLQEPVPLYSLGAIVHNNEELQRLSNYGLQIIEPSQLSELPPHSRVLIRAHGEPPQIYKTALEHQLDVIECTCPVVIRLQQHIKEEYRRLQQLGGTLLIFGKRGHAEVNGLVGQTDGGAIVIENAQEVADCSLAKGPVSLFSQTTKDTHQFEDLCQVVLSQIRAQGGDEKQFKCFHTICHQVSGRTEHLRDFAATHSIILFVSGTESSNGHVLYEVCRKANPRSYAIEKAADIQPAWFQNGDNVGVCGATSTPKWLMEQVAQTVEKL